MTSSAAHRTWAVPAPGPPSSLRRRNCSRPAGRRRPPFPRSRVAVWLRVRGASVGGPVWEVPINACRLRSPNGSSGVRGFL